MIPCNPGFEHRVPDGVKFCVHCGLIPETARQRKRRRQKARREPAAAPQTRRRPLIPEPGAGLDRQMRRLIKKYGGAAVEESFYLVLQQEGDHLLEEP